MGDYVKITWAAAILAHLCSPALLPQSWPFDGKTFRGRIAYSADGNHNDEDDWAASPVALAIFAEFGVKDKLVHFDYNSILTNTNPDWEQEHETGVLGAAERYGYRRAIFYDCQKDRNGAIDSIARAINESSADDPLYFIIAGPMEVAYLGIRKSDPEKRKFVYCISHSRWNDGFSTTYVYRHNKRSVIPSGIQWLQIRDQNEFLSTSPFGRPASEEEWRPWLWMRDSKDSKVRFLWDRLRATTRADCSDAGMAYFLMTGDEESRISKLRTLLDEKTVSAPVGPRKYVRLEAENFLTLDQYDLEFLNDRAVSHRISVKLTSVTTGRIRTRFEQPYTAPSGRYDVDVRYFDGKDGRSRFVFHVNGAQKGDAWHASSDAGSWMTHTIPDVEIRRGDEIMVEVRGDSGEYGKLDYVQLNYKGPAPDSPGPARSSSPSSEPTAAP